MRVCVCTLSGRARDVNAFKAAVKLSLSRFAHLNL